MPDGSHEPAIVSCRVLHLPVHGWCWQGVALTGEILVVPLRRHPYERLRDWLVVDRAMNGRPAFAGRRRRNWWLFRAKLLRA